MGTNVEDPWGRDPSDVLGDEDVIIKNRPPTAKSVDKWGENDEEGDIGPQVTKASSRPSSQAKAASSRPSSQPNSQTRPSSQADRSPSQTKPASRPSSQQNSNSRPSSQQRTSSRPSSQQKTITRPSSQADNTSRPFSQQNTNSRPSSQQRSSSRPSFQQNPNSRPPSQAKAVSRPSSVDQMLASPRQQNRRDPVFENREPKEEPPSSKPTTAKSRSGSSKRGSPILNEDSTSGRQSRPTSKHASNGSRPSSKFLPKNYEIVTNDEPAGSVELRNDTKRIRDPNIKLPKAVNKDEIRQRAFDNMKNKKAHPSYLFTKFSNVIEALMRYLPYRSLCHCQRVCRAWYKVGREEKLRRTFVDSDCYKVELTNEEVEDEQDDDLQIDLHKLMAEMFVQPCYILAFMTWRTVTTLPDILFRVSPLNCSTTCVASSSGVYGTRKNGKIRIYVEEARECCSALLMPKIDKFAVYQFSAFRPDQLHFNDRLFDSAGLKKYDDKKQVKCLLILISGGKTRNSIQVTTEQVEKWEGEFQDAFQCRACVVGACLNFSQHGIKRILGTDSKLYSTQNDVNGIVFQGENLEVQSFAFRKIDEESVAEQLNKVKSFIGRSPSNSFALILNGLQDQDEKVALKQFKSVLPNTRLAGVKTSYAVFGHNFSSYEHRMKQSRETMLLGEYLVLVVFKIARNVNKQSMKKANGSKSRGDGGKLNILRAHKVK